MTPQHRVKLDKCTLKSAKKRACGSAVNGVGEAFIVTLDPGVEQVLVLEFTPLQGHHLG